MQRTIRVLLISTTTLIPLYANGNEPVIQQVAGQGCTSGGCGVDGCTSEGCNSCRSGGSRRLGRKARRGDMCEPLEGNGRRCNFRSSSRDFALNWTGNCGPIGRLARWGFPGAKTMCWCCNTKAYPDSGWAPPAHTPITRTGGSYNNYASAGHYGGGSYGPGAPMVYQPTDTTQLGYTYANVPTWQPNPSKIPQVPIPSNFHARFCPADARCSSCSTGCETSCMPGYIGGDCMNGGCISGCYMGSDCMNGQCMGGEMFMGNNNPHTPPGFVRMVQQHRNSQVSQAVGLPVRAIRPVRVQKPQIRPVSNTTEERMTAKVPNKTMKPSGTSPQPKPIQQRPANGNRSAGRQSASHRPQSKKGSGWLGLPSLSQLQF